MLSFSARSSLFFLLLLLEKQKKKKQKKSFNIDIYLYHWDVVFSVRTSTIICIEHSGLVMPIPGWLHVNGVSFTNETHPDQQAAPNVSEAIAEELGHPSSISASTNLLEGQTQQQQQHISRQYQKFELTDLPKKLFIDRQIKKAKSLPGLIK